MNLKRYYFTVLVSLFSFTVQMKAQTWDWIKTYDTSEDCGEGAKNIGLDKWGNIYIKGTSICASGGPNSSFQESNLILKYDNSGNLVSAMPIVNGWWRATIDPNGNIYVSANNFVKKYDQNGQLQWSKTIPNRYFLTIDANRHGVILTGRTGYPYCTDSSAYCMLDCNGNELWNRKGDFTPSCGDDNVFIDKTDKVYSITGNELIIIDSLGSVLNRFQLSAFNSPHYFNYKICVLADKSIVVSALDAYSSPTLTTTIAGYNSQGNLLWSGQLTGKGSIANMKLDKDDNIYMAGYMSGTVQYQSTTISAAKNMFVFKLSPSGSVLWEKHTTGIDGGVNPFDFILDGESNIYICGALSETHTFDGVSITGGIHGDMFVAKLSQPSVIMSFKNESNRTELFSVNPNPSSGIFKVECEDLKNCDVKVQIMNSLGQQVHIESHQHITGSYSKVFDMAGLPKGIYFVEVKTNEDRYIKKVVLE
jgi:hypothetical protein